ncbi:MAG: hypothetical protein PW843_10755 [Azospirillaceae bacterium]|nr:hypothetical protein [Azospirillaceae bacterium]
MDGWQRRYRLDSSPGGLGVRCTDDGLALAGVPLLTKGAGGLQVRPAVEVTTLLRRAYAGTDPGAAVLPGLAKIADALNRGELAHAMIRAVHLRLPELDWDAAARLARANDDLAKYSPDQPRDDHGRWTGNDGAADTAQSHEGYALAAGTQPQAAGGKTCGIFYPKAGTLLNAQDGEKLFNDVLKKLRDAGTLPTQSTLMDKLFPDFKFVPYFTTVGPDGNPRKYPSLKGADKDHDDNGYKIVGGFTRGGYSEIYRTSAAAAYIPGLGDTTPAETMEFAIMHEWGHQNQGGHCGGNGGNEECCADSFALRHMGGGNGNR